MGFGGVDENSPLIKNKPKFEMCESAKTGIDNLKKGIVSGLNKLSGKSGINMA